MMLWLRLSVVPAIALTIYMMKQKMAGFSQLESFASLLYQLHRWGVGWRDKCRGGYGQVGDRDRRSLRQEELCQGEGGKVDHTLSQRVKLH